MFCEKVPGKFARIVRGTVDLSRRQIDSEGALLGLDSAELQPRLVCQYLHADCKIEYLAKFAKF